MLLHISGATSRGWQLISIYLITVLIVHIINALNKFIFPRKNASQLISPYIQK